MFPLPGEDGEAPVVDDELLPCPSQRHVPADVLVSRPKVVARRAPDHQRQPLSVFVLEDDAHGVAPGMGLAHVVVLAFELVESLEFRRLVDVPNPDFPVHEMRLLQSWTSISSQKSPLLSSAGGNPIMTRRIEIEINHHALVRKRAIFLC